MTSPSPSHVELDSTRYRIVPNSYKEWVESSYQAQPGIAGASRPAENPRPDVRTWRWDDWSKGEGYKFYNSEQGHPSQRGYYFGSLIDPSVPGEVRLGYQLATTLNSGTPAQGPYLAVAGTNVWTAYASTTQELTTLGATIAADVWTSRTSGMNAQTIDGPVSGHMSGVYIAGTRSGADGGVRRVTSAGSTQWAAEAAKAPAASDAYVYYLTRGTTSSALKRSGLDAAVAGTSITSFLGVGTTYNGHPVQSVAVGRKVYTLLVNGDESLRLWEYDGEAGREVAVFTGLRTPAADDLAGGAEQSASPMCVVDGVVFIVGYEYSAQKSGLKIGRVDYFDGERPATLLALSGRLDTDVLSFTGSNGVAFRSCAPGDDHSFLISADVANPDSDQLFRYSLRTGGIWHLANDGGHSSLLEHRGVIFAAKEGGVIQRTLASGTGKYAATGSIASPIWDFDLPDTEKLLTEIEVQGELPANTQVQLQLYLDNGTVITTDGAGNPLTLSGATSRGKFTISDADTERTFRWMLVIAELTNTGGVTSVTPILYNVTSRCIPIPNAIRFFEFDINLQDETAADRRTGQQLTGAKQRATLETLRDSTTNRLFTMTPLFKDTKPPYPGPTETQHTVMFAANTQNGIFESSDKGEGRMKLRLMKVG